MTSDSFYYFINLRFYSGSRYLSLIGRAEPSLVGRFYVLIHMLVITLFIMFSVTLYKYSKQIFVI